MVTDDAPRTGGAVQDSGGREAALATPSGFLERFKPLWASVLGLAFGRAGLIVACYGSYENTDEGVFTDGAMLANLAIMAVILLVFAVRKARMHKRSVNITMRACIAVETVCVLALSFMHFFGVETFASRFSLCVVCTFTSSYCIFYWLRRARGTNTTTATVYVFSALIVSEVELYLTTLLPPEVSAVLAGVLVLVQYPCMLWARAERQPYSIKAPTQATDFFSFSKTMVQSKRFLAATAIGIGFLSLVIGLLRGYPDGLSIAFTRPTRLAYGLLTIAICLALIWLVLRGRPRVMTTGIFVLMELLACVALLCYAAAPDALYIGAVFTTTLNAIMVGLSWYITIAFMSYGNRDPYFYALAGWVVWLGCRAGTRMLLTVTSMVSVNSLLAGTVMGVLLVISTQVVLVQFMNVAASGEGGAAGTRAGAGAGASAAAGAEAGAGAGAGGAADAGVAAPGASADAGGAAPAGEDAAERPSRDGMLLKIMGLDEAESLADMRQAAMRRSAEEVGRQFMLSEREVDVLALYALGWTQKRVAEELYISPGTAHAHVKRIYAKTGMHSRQEVLDYMREYAS